MQLRSGAIVSCLVYLISGLAVMIGLTLPVTAQTQRPIPGRPYRGPEFAAKLHAFDAKYKVTSRGE